MTIQDIQNRITNKGDLREIVNLLADYIQVNTAGSSSYLVYTALLTQSGTNAPVAEVLENTLGFDITWEYLDVGTYAGNFGQEKLVEKCWCKINNVLSSVADCDLTFPEVSSGEVINKVYSNVFQWVAGARQLSNNWLYHTGIEIRVYQ